MHMMSDKTEEGFLSIISAFKFHSIIIHAQSSYSFLKFGVQLLKGGGGGST